MYKHSRKEDLFRVVEELGGTTESTDTVAKLREKIEATDLYKTDLEFVKSLINSVIEERMSQNEIELRERETQVALENQKIELQKLKLAQLEKEIELQTARNHALSLGPKIITEENQNGISIENLIRSVKTLTLPVPTKAENFNLFFQSLERAFITKNVHEELKSEILINILGEKANNVLLYIKGEELKDYNKLKYLILREYQPTPQECLKNFKNAIKLAGETYIQFAARLTANFEYYCQLRNVDSFESLCELIIADKLYETLNKEIATHIGIRQAEGWFTPIELAKECDIFVTSRSGPYKETSIARGYTVDTFKNRERDTINTRSERFPRTFDKQNKECYICGDKNHYARYCPKRHKKPHESNREILSSSDTDRRNHNVVNNVKFDKQQEKNNFFQELQYVDILVENQPIKALIDSGAQIPVINSSLIEIKKSLEGEIILSSCFGEKREAGVARVEIAINENSPKLEIVVAATPKLSAPCILTPNVYHQLQNLHREIDHSKTTNDSKNESSFDECFLFHISNVYDACDLDLTHINDFFIKNELSLLVNNYKPNKIKDTKLKMNIVLKDDVPVCQRARRLSFPEKQKVNDQINEWLNRGIIRESCSDYCSPLVLCTKKDGNLRLCIDFRRLNAKTVKDRYPLPLIEEILDQLQSGKLFSTLDLKNGFFHVEMGEDSMKFTSFVTHDGQYEFNKVPFGLCYSPSIFQRYINHVFRDLFKEGLVIIYMDDIIIPSVDETDGLKRLSRVLQTASEYGLELNLKKCKFMKSKIEFLGHIIENGTIRPSLDKTTAVQNFPKPKDAKQVQSFLGLTGFFRKFIRNYSVIAKPLSDLLRANVVFYFGPEQQLAFETLKQKLSENPILHIFKQGARLELHTDASKFGYGAILFQQANDNKLHPIHYMSKKTTPQEEKYSSYELEVLAIIEALKKFRNYLTGNKFTIVTDCSAFQKTMSKRELTTKIARWALFLEDFNYEIIHRPGKQMKHVDCLSRYPIMLVSYDEITSKVVNCQKSDEYINSIKQLLENKQINDFIVKNNVLYKIENDTDLLVVPQLMQTEIVKNIHSKGHFGITKIENVVKQSFYFPHLRKCVEQVISNCIDCILVNRKRGKSEGFLNPIPKGDIPLSTYHIDFIGPLPSTNKNYNHVFTVIDSFTKFTWFYPVKSTSSQDAIDKLKFQQFTFGNPSRIVTDRGTAFTSKEFETYCQDEGIEHIKVTTGIPRGNGQVEIIHKTLIPILSKLSIADPTKWFKYVSTVQKVINSTVSRSTKFTPFELLTGVKLKDKTDLNVKEILEEEYLNSMMEDRNNMREEARENILKIQEENRKSFNKRRKEPHVYKPGDLVAIQRTQFGTGLKLRPKFHGPYRIVKVKPKDRYDVEKVGNHEGPIITSTAADHMKMWGGLI